jgi:hypothetical protein
MSGRKGIICLALHTSSVCSTTPTTKVWHPCRPEALTHADIKFLGDRAISSTARHEPRSLVIWAILHRPAKTQIPWCQWRLHLLLHAQLRLPCPPGELSCPTLPHANIHANLPSMPLLYIATMPLLGRASAMCDRFFGVICNALRYARLGPMLRPYKCKCQHPDALLCILLPVLHASTPSVSVNLTHVWCNTPPHQVSGVLAALDVTIRTIDCNVPYCWCLNSLRPAQASWSDPSQG